MRERESSQNSFGYFLEIPVYHVTDLIELIERKIVHHRKCYRTWRRVKGSSN